MAPIALKWVTFALFNATFVAVLVWVVWIITREILAPDGPDLTFMIVLFGGIVVVNMIVLIAGITATRRFRRVKRDWPNSPVYQVTPHENFDVLVASFAAQIGVAAPTYRPWDVYVVIDGEFVSFLAGSSGCELVSLRRDRTTATVGRLLQWTGLIPVVRLSVPGLPDVSLASSVLISGGMISRSRRSLRRIAEDIGMPDEVRR